MKEELQTTKDYIVSVLIEHWPLTTKTIHAVINRKYAQQATYQSVHKAMKQLQEQQILLCQDKKYYLNIDWVKQIKTFATEIEKNYNTQNGQAELEKEEYLQMKWDREKIQKPGEKCQEENITSQLE